MFDALIIGAGPAGATAARLLAGAGWHVALVEKAQFPRRKVCGEFLSAPTWSVLEACGVGEAFEALAGPPVRKVGIFSGDVTMQAPAGPVLGRALGRETLDTLLRDAAVAAGAVLHQPCEVTSVQRQGAIFSCTLRNGEETQSLGAHTVIVASGSWSARGPFAIAAPHAPSDLLAFKGHFRGGRLAPGLMPLLAFPGGYGGLVECDGGRISLSCCIRRDALAQARVRHGGRAAAAVLAHIRATTRGVDDVLRHAQADGDLLAAGPIQPGIRSRFRDGIFFAGNAAGEAHPVIAEGISMAIQGGALLADRLIAAGASAAADAGPVYAHDWHRNYAPRIRAASLFAALAMHDPARTFSLRLLQQFPGVIGWGVRASGKLSRSCIRAA